MESIIMISITVDSNLNYNEHIGLESFNNNEGNVLYYEDLNQIKLYLQKMKNLVPSDANFRLTFSDTFSLLSLSKSFKAELTIKSLHFNCQNIGHGASLLECFEDLQNKTYECIRRWKKDRSFTHFDDSEITDENMIA